MAHCRVKLFHDWWPHDRSIWAAERVPFSYRSIYEATREAGERIRELARAPRRGLALANQGPRAGSKTELLFRIAEHEFGFAAETIIRSRDLTVTNKILHTCSLDSLLWRARLPVGGRWQASTGWRIPLSVWRRFCFSALAACLDAFSGRPTQVSQGCRSRGRGENVSARSVRRKHFWSPSIALWIRLLHESGRTPAIGQRS